MQRITRLDLPLLLPDVPDSRDACIARLTSAVQAKQGVVQAHVLDTGETEAGTTTPVSGPVLCLHYDADRITLAEVEALARAAGAATSEQFAHVLVPIHAVSTEDDGTRLESVLRGAPGVTAASVSLAGQVARVEFDRTVTSRAKIDALLRDASVEPRTVARARASDGDGTSEVPHADDDGHGHAEIGRAHV